MMKYLSGALVASSLATWAFAQDDSLKGFIWEDPKDPNITYWEAGTPMKSPEVLAVMWIICDRLQPIFDKTTGDAYTFIPHDIVKYARQNGDETLIICEDKGQGDI